MTISTRFTQNLLVTFTVIILLLAVLWGYVAGSRAGKSEVILKNTQVVADGLKLFFADQNRYPSSQEFADQDIMLGYFNLFPFADITGGSCNKTYSYYSVTPKSYQLNFCLPKARNGFTSGINQVAQP